MRELFRRTLLASVLAVLAVVAVSSADAQTYWFGKNKIQYKDFEWKVLKTPHFDIHFSEGYNGLAAKTAVILEHGYDKLSRDFAHHISWRIPVIIYGSHSDFQQTNITWELIPEGVQAFAEPLRRRMVLHFPGSNVDYIHTTVHELVHIFSFDIIYSRLLKSVFSRTMLFQIPLWFMEGLAEYYSAGYDDEVEMFMRDATVFDYLMNLNETGGYMTYKAGQAALFYINETYGPGKVLEIKRDGTPVMGKVSFSGIQKDVCLEWLPEVEVGDYVIVHVGFAISKMDEKEALETLKMLEEMGRGLDELDESAT